MSLSREKKSIIILVSMLVILLAAVIAIFLSLKTNPVKDQIKKDELIKILLVVNDDENQVLATDVLLYNPANNKCVLFDIPGNVGAIYQVIERTDRIDAVYTEKGIDVYNSEIEKLLDLDIPFTIEISLDNLGTLTDMFSGMSVFIPNPVDEVSENGQRWLLPSGAVNLDGDKLKTYMLYTVKGEERNEQETRRQNVVIALLTALGDNRTLLLDEDNFMLFAEKMHANVDEEGLYTILESISNVETDSLAPRTVSGLIRYVDGKELLFPMYSGDLIKEVVTQAVNSVLSDEEAAQKNGYALEVLNGTDRTGLAGRTSKNLSDAGYDVIKTDNADRNDYEHTMIINHHGEINSEAARSLANFIMCNYIVNEPFSISSDGGAEVDFTLILGEDFDGRYVRGNYTPPENEVQSAEETESTNFEE